MQVNESPQQPTTANEGQCSVFQCVFFHFLFSMLITTRQRPPHPSLANTSRGWVYSPPPTTHHHHHHHLTTSSTTSSQRRPTKANAGQRRQKGPKRRVWCRLGPRCVFVHFLFFILITCLLLRDSAH